jgi:hypothetical protein
MHTSEGFQDKPRSERPEIGILRVRAGAEVAMVCKVDRPITLDCRADLPADQGVAKPVVQATVRSQVMMRGLVEKELEIRDAVADAEGAEHGAGQP